MFLEVVMLNVIPGEEKHFECSFREASKLIQSAKGCLNHELRRCVEDSSKYILLVRWENLDDHTEGFRGSEDYRKWSSLLHHYYDPFPVVEHFSEPIG